jgi:head-tail adaptor
MILSLIQTRGQSITVLRPSVVRDAVGSRKQTFIPLPPFQGYVASRSMSEGFEGDRQQAEEVITVFVEGDTDIKVTDRIQIDGRTFEVTGKRTPGMRKDTDRLFFHVIDATSNEVV